ncbi:hypothetical protein ABV589_16455 [Pseudomonas sp. HOU2]|uniref:hypothetical protein n=1 Tax=Pseudomonas sp. HOU2 TaxID=3230301 RepID=UPI00345809B8
MSSIDTALNFLDQGRVGLFVGVVIAIIAYLKSRQRTRVGYVHLGEHLLGSASDALPAGIDVQYEGISVPRLTKSIIIIWNNGENTVSGSDIVEKDPLRFHVGRDGKILSTSVLKVSREVNEFRVVSMPGQESNEAVFTFDFLDASDGAVVEILHTSTNRSPSAKGTLRGLPKGLRNLGQFTRPKPQKKKRSGALSIVAAVVFSPPVLACAGFAAAVYLPRPELLVDIAKNESAYVGFSGVMGAVFGVWAVNTFSARRRYPKSLHLEALE